ncbi:MAG TPA: bifunctional UDP-N-acetylglucosamine diphosphorylase/glucosamine-1-phosphate N-acetyltransferase GlmU [Terriglobales bacterium]|nr:bifunctional UDP-N-acetylglucosamine diphosphorylase/glucosamine-1-phosphate N-acetyltransferase GlmU [Terriglobales bacterium]
MTTAVVVLAAGKGTRMHSRLPKVLHQAGGRSMLASVLKAAGDSGVAGQNTAVVAGYGIEAIRAALAGSEVEIVLQEPQLGTGHAVLCAQSWWKRHPQVIVVHGDMPLLSAATIGGLARARSESGAAAVLATAAPAEPRAYGRIVRDRERPERVLRIVEEKQATAEQLKIRELNAGFYCFETAALAEALAQLGTDNPHGEYYLTDTIALLAPRGVVAYPLEDDRECLGVNDRAELAELDSDLRRRKVAALLKAGVSVQLPDTVVVDPEVEVGEDTVIESGVQLLGATRIGAGCRIRAHSVVESASVEDGAIIGPFARLREGAVIGAGAHIGNFVEVKKSRIGKGSKANHLAYIGDAVVGERANIGAGTITCNYDGVHKHSTVIGDGAFIGSNSTLVAPVEIGAGAYVGAGSVITEEVPGDALGLGRARQAVKPGWAAARRQTVKRK